MSAASWSGQACDTSAIAASPIAGPSMSCTGRSLSASARQTRHEGLVSSPSKK